MFVFIVMLSSSPVPMYMSQFDVFILSHFKLNLISCERKQSFADGPSPAMTPGCVRIAPELGFYTSFLPTSFCRYTDSSSIASHSEYASISSVSYTGNVHTSERYGVGQFKSPLLFIGRILCEKNALKPI